MGKPSLSVGIIMNKPMPASEFPQWLKQWNANPKLIDGTI
jgi:hypothetical protein